MKSYKVIALSVGGLNNKIFNSGDEVFENNFHPGRADQLVVSGFLKEIKESEDLPILDSLNSKTPLSIDEFEVTDIKQNLTNFKVDFDSNATKQELYNLWLSVSQK